MNIYQRLKNWLNLTITPPEVIILVPEYVRLEHIEHDIKLELVIQDPIPPKVRKPRKSKKTPPVA